MIYRYQYRNITWSPLNIQFKEKKHYTDKKLKMFPHSIISDEWVSDCSLMPIQQFNFQWDDDEVCFVLDQHAKLDFYSASSLRQQSVGIHVAPLGHIILIPSQPVLALYP
jgi:hypothetical protein